MKVKFTDLYKLVVDKKKIQTTMNSMIKNNQFVGGKEVQLFEEDFSNYTKSKYCVSLANGTDALILAIKALNLKKKGEIIVPVNTWISTAEAVIACDQKVIFCDINLHDYSICLNDLKKKITSTTRAIIPVHLYGNPANMVAIKKIIKNKNIKLIEDCAQAAGAKIGGNHVGNFGDIGTFSYFPGKNLGCFGDGGSIVTNNKKYYNYILRARNHGALKKYDHKFSGFNSRLDAIQAGVLRIKLKSYNICLNKRKKISKIYYKELANIKELKMYKLDKKNTSCYHQFVIRTKKRNQLKIFLNKCDVETMIHYPYMLNELDFFKYKKKLINSNKLGKKILSLPISEEHTVKQIHYICNKIKFFFKS